MNRATNQPVGNATFFPTRWRIVLLMVFFLPVCCLRANSKTNQVGKAQVKISGYGWLGDRKMKQMLAKLESTE